jgi:hypothetical protein
MLVYYNRTCQDVAENKGGTNIRSNLRLSIQL